MFDFINYTYSGMLSIVAAVFGIAYPHINNSIIQVDEKFHSTMITNRFKEKKIFSAFKFILIINLICIVLIPFLMDMSTHCYIFITIQTIATVALIFSFFLLYDEIQSFNDASGLHKQIWTDFEKAYSKKEKDTERYFKEWIDLVKFILNSSDKDAIREIYDKLSGFIHKYTQSVNERLIFENYIYDGIHRLNECLCKQEYQPMAVNNANGLLTLFLSPYKYISDNTYRMLWYDLGIQMYYSKDEWIMGYWEQASQYYELYMQVASVYDRNSRTGKCYTELEIKTHNLERRRFLEFHIMLCALLLQSGKYDLLKRILEFTQSYPPVYPLIPSTFGECFQFFKSINELYEYDPSTLDKRYPMPQFKGLATGKILGVANRYIALLVFRLYTLQFYPYGVDYVFSLPNTPDNLQDVKKEKDYIIILRGNADMVAENKLNLKCIGIDDFNLIIKKIRHNYSVQVKKIDEYLDEYLSILETKIKDLKINQEYSPQKTEQLKNDITHELEESIEEYSLFIKANNLSQSEDDSQEQKNTQYLVDGTVAHIYPNTAFVDKPSVSYVDIDTSMSGSMMYKFRHYFASTFMLQNCQLLNMDSQNLFEAIDRLKLSSSKHIIISFGLYLNYFLDKVSDLSEIETNKYLYKEIPIYNFRSGSKYFANYMFILDKEDLPHLNFQKPSDDYLNKYELKNYHAVYQIWMSILRLKQNKDLLSDDEKKEITENIDESALFTCTLISKVTWKKETEMICIKVMYQGVDNGNSNKVDDVKPFDSYFKAH